MSSEGTSSRTSVRRGEEEQVIGFDDEAVQIIEQVCGVRMRLEVVSIVGMPGLGKTTLAKKLYNDPFVVYHFYIRGWTTISQVYTIKDLLRGIFGSAFKLKDDDIPTGTTEQLGGELYRRLKDKRYLIVMDDIWDIRACSGLRIFLPNDNNGSRIMFTRRLADVALQAEPTIPPHYLRFLNQHESWVLLQHKIFQGECPYPELFGEGNRIAKKCHGLPLAIVVVAGLLSKTEKKLNRWREVASSVSSYIASDPNQYMDTLALSYNHLPEHLKLCFLYFGAFPEDYHIPEWKLIWLWVAEGFVKEIEQKNLEDVAREYLADLADRNLVLVAKRRFNGGIKACHIHDMLRDLCLTKAKEEEFLQLISQYRDFSSQSNHTTNNIHRPFIHSDFLNYLCSNPVGSDIRSLLCFSSERNRISVEYALSFYQSFKLLRVLDLLSIAMPFLPQEIVQWSIHLRYLALKFEKASLPNSISDLFNLEFLVVKIVASKPITIPNTVWKLVKLRYLVIDSGENHIEDPRFEETIINDGSFVLDNLYTISQVRPSKSCQEVLARTPNLRKLRFCGDFMSEFGFLWFPRLDFLMHLETLKLHSITISITEGHLSSCKFPPNLKRLTISGMVRKWEEMSVLGMLPNLEVLKLSRNAFIGPLWETNDGGFNRLKFLKLHFIATLKRWKTSRDHFPNIERLVVQQCEKLEEIPSELGYIPTLRMIEISHLSHSAANSARQIMEEQQSMGNDGLKITIYPPNEGIP
ncbi:unnamed protein product [Ilex paraguariensis]|uniref:Uncharacterized protein n=1 Tax=Ilex paraguariensis TaxID=185542 RepID=A0ABC8QY89_9AQUA